VPSGYGTQTALFASRFRDLGHEVIIFATYGCQATGSMWNGIPVLPSAFDGYGNDILGAHASAVKPDLVIILYDAWPMSAQVIKGIRHPAPEAGWSGCPVAMWMPVDVDRLGAADERMLRESGAQPVAMSRHGEKSLAAAGFSPLFAPHAADMSVLSPPADREALRRTWGVEGRFVIGINGANKDGTRKGYAEQFLAFSRFRARHPEALMLVHALPQVPGNQLDLEVLARRCGIADAVMFTDRYKYVTGLLSPANLAEWYGVLDVLSCCSYGEGFGIPIIEAAGCGTPAVVTDGSAMTELRGPGWTVAGEPFWNPVHEAWWTKPSVDGIVRAYEKALLHAGSKRAAAREFAMQYDADAVLLEHWKPALDVLKEAKAAA
jgi:glycosyltransferase involved in cell wall biosynthesis